MIIQLAFIHNVGINHNLRILVTIQHFEFLLRALFSALGKVLNFEQELAIALPHFLLPSKMAATCAMHVGVAFFVYTARSDQLAT